MKKRILFSILMIGMVMGTQAQKPTMTLTFTAEINGQHVPLNSILIENLTQGGDTTLFAPDTVLIMDYITGVSKNKKIGENELTIFQNYPNPMEGKTKVSFYLYKKEYISITINDIIGRVLINKEYQLEQGNHTFIFYPGKENLYFFTARTFHQIQTIKMFNSPNYANRSGNYKLEYNGQQSSFNEYKSETDLNNFNFNFGDTLKFTSFAYLGEQDIISCPTGDQTYYFDYSGYPCPGTPSVTDFDGNTYNTVLIGNQCWMNENLKTTTYANGAPIPNVTDNIEWSNLTSGAFIWYDNDIGWKDSYGALYNWHTTVDSNGLCPTGWHVPTNDEWTALTDFIGGTSSPHGNELKSCRQVNSPFGEECNTSEHPRWNNNLTYYGTDDFSFSGLPGGYRDIFGTFYDIGAYCYWWSSTEYYGLSWCRSLRYNLGVVEEPILDRPLGFSVRCLRDN